MQAMNFKDRRGLVTGAAPGLGDVMARPLARDGAHRILVARRQERLATVKAEREPS